MASIKRWFQWIIEEFFTRTPEVEVVAEGPKPVPPPPSKNGVVTTVIEGLFLPVPKGSRMTSPFGPRTIRGERKIHKGIDWGVPEGTEIYAMGSGLIWEVGWENPFDKFQGYGYRIIQRMDSGSEVCWVFYAHLSESLVEKNQKVNVGDVIALSGNTGSSTGPHLHVSSRCNNTGKYTKMEFDDE